MVRRMALEITVAGRTIEDARRVVEHYARSHPRTLTRYDASTQECHDVISAEDVAASRVLASRISRAQGEEILELAASHHELLAQIPKEADLADADPAESQGLYDKGADLLTALQGPWVRVAKASKVLHLKRPALFPILDSGLTRLYRSCAAEAARRYPERGHRRMFWAAIRNDLRTNVDTLAELRKQISDADAQALTRDLTDLRLMDILAWEASRRSI
ncbi:hypothetical protein GCM10027055_09530 [Janibacter alkaliphilus]